MVGNDGMLVVEGARRGRLFRGLFHDGSHGERFQCHPDFTRVECTGHEPRRAEPSCAKFRHTNSSHAGAVWGG